MVDGSWRQLSRAAVSVVLAFAVLCVGLLAGCATIEVGGAVVNGGVAGERFGASAVELAAGAQEKAVNKIEEDKAAEEKAAQEAAAAQAQSSARHSSGSNSSTGEEPADPPTVVGNSVYVPGFGYVESEGKESVETEVPGFEDVKDEESVGH